MQELHWVFEIEADELWLGVEAGIAVVGQTYRAQDATGREGMRAAYAEITSEQVVNTRLGFPSLALIASARRAC